MPINATINGTTTGDGIKGTAESDVIAAGSGKDRVVAAAGDDTVFGGTGVDKVYGGDGNDELYGNGGADRLYGGSGNDTIVGGIGDDVLYGDNPNDGNDNEGGVDTFVFSIADGKDNILDFETNVDLIQFIDGSEADLSFAYKGDATIITYGTTTITVYDAYLDASDIGTSLLF